VADRAADLSTSRVVRPSATRRQPPPLTGAARPRAAQVSGYRPPPPRPSVDGAIAPPTDPVEPAPPMALRISATLWFAACAAALVGLGAALADGSALRARLTDTATAADATATADAVRDAVSATLTLVLGGVAALVVLTLVWTALLLRRRSWARWMLLITGLVLLLAVDVAQSVVSGGAELDRISLLAAAALVVLAVVPLVARSSGAWLRRDEN
jgi:hypothetical protein